MPEQPTIIIQNSNQQNNDGCADGCGWGCLVLVAASVLLIPFGLIGSGLDEGQGGTVAIGVVLTIVEILVIGVVLFFWLDKKLGWGYRDGDTPNSAGTVRPEDLAGDASNYGFSEEPEKPGTEKTEKIGRRLPHPDDPLERPRGRPRTVIGPGAGVDQSVTLSGGAGGEAASKVNESDVYERLKRLKDLRDEGHLTDEEYAAKKEELLKLL